jgi:hypothetical protein
MAYLLAVLRAEGEGVAFALLQDYAWIVATNNN